MSEINYIIRKDNVPEVIFDDNELKSILKKEYPYILNSITDENYFIHNNNFNLFKEILFEGKVVGFASYLMSDVAMALCEVYILPEFRGNDLFFEEINNMIYSGHNLLIKEPTRNLIEILVNYDFACEWMENIVVSSISFELNRENTSASDGSHSAGGNKTRLYDLNICASLAFDDFDEPEIIYYNNPLDEDIDEYDCLVVRNSIDENYFDNIINVIISNKDELLKLMSALQKILPSKDYAYERIVGEGDGLSEYMQNLVDEGEISYDIGLDIKNWLIEDYANGKVKNDGLFNRVNYLIGLANGNINLEGDTSQLLKCPDCGCQLTFEENYCSVCGYNLDLIEYEDIFDYDTKNNSSYMNNILGGEINSKYLGDISQILKNQKTGDYSLKKADNQNWDYYLYKFLEFIDENHEIDAYFTLNPDMDLSLKDYVIDNDYVTFNITSDCSRDFLKSLTADEIKNILEKNDIKCSGGKHSLISKVAENDIDLTEFNQSRYYLTDSADAFLQDNLWIYIYDIALKEFSFSDFSSYISDSSNLLFESVIDYLDEHIKIADENKNHEYLLDTLTAKAAVYSFYTDLDKALYDELAVFLLSLNPIYDIDTSTVFYLPLSELNTDNIIYLSDAFEKEKLLGIVNQVWNQYQFENALISKKEALKILNELLDGTDVGEINNKLYEKYFKDDKLFK